MYHNNSFYKNRRITVRQGINSNNQLTSLNSREFQAHFFSCFPMFEKAYSLLQNLQISFGLPSWQFFMCLEKLLNKINLSSPTNKQSLHQTDFVLFGFRLIKSDVVTSLLLIGEHSMYASR